MWSVGDRIRWVSEDVLLNKLCGTVVGLNGKESIDIHWDNDIQGGLVTYGSYHKNLQFASYDDFAERIKERLG